MITKSPPEDRRQWQLLATPLGQPGSAISRYAAAMYFYQRGMMDEVALEVFRVCAKLDSEDPYPTLAKLGQTIPFAPPAA